MMENKKQKKKIKLSDDTQAIISTLIEVERINAKLRCDLEKSRVKTDCDIAKLQSAGEWTRCVYIIAWIGFIGFNIMEYPGFGLIAMISFSAMGIWIQWDYSRDSRKK